MARVADDCRWCRTELVVLRMTIITDPKPWLACRNCDTADAINPGNRLRGCPPNMPGSKAGWMLPN